MAPAGKVGVQRLPARGALLLSRLCLRLKPRLCILENMARLRKQVTFPTRLWHEGYVLCGGKKLLAAWLD